MKKRIFPVCKIVLSVITIPLWFVKIFAGTGFARPGDRRNSRSGFSP